MRIFKGIAAALVSLLLLPCQGLADTSFYFRSSPQSWVGHGETVLVTPNEGFQFSVSRNFDNGVSIFIDDVASNPNFGSTRWWYLAFAAPNDAPLVVGNYAGATRFPFQSSSAPGLSFLGNGRGNNQLTGQFSVLEATYAQSGSVLSFAADFVQYDEGCISCWNIGSVRYNSLIPVSAVPEPSAFVLLVAGLAGVVATARRRRHLK